VTSDLCPIVGIGASAGSFNALAGLFHGMPTDTGAAFVVIQHPDPLQESVTADSLMRCTSMPTSHVIAGMPIEPNHIYVVPPHSPVRLKGHHLELGKPLLHQAVQMPIDTFFSSLAEQHRERGVAIIVSGGSTDGTLGIRAAKGSGGLVLAQCPTTAQNDGMPLSVIATGLVDFVCPVEAMHEHITGYLQHVERIHRATLGQSAPLAGANAHCMSQILAVLASRTGHDFREYKQGTVVRRIARRMALRRVDTLTDYLAYLRAHEDEATKLLQDLAIGITQFYRDADAFDELNRRVIAPLVANKHADEPLRVWVPGCATGEEAYSVAMLFIEHLDEEAKFCPIRVFATDIDDVALSVARRGLYPDGAAAHLSADRLERFFTKEGHGYRVNKRLRQCVNFSTQNLTSDPPFSKLDLICCRNLLIYLNARAQRSALALFHFALREEGCLFLGFSETTSHQDALFEPLSKKWHIYKRNGAKSLPAMGLLGSPEMSHAAVTVRGRSHKTTIAASDEALSVNEELQAANEELESSKEEMRSVNEELSAVNSELKDKMEELARSTDDLTNILSSTDIATLFVDTEIKIGRFTPSIVRVMNLIPSDIGRPLCHIDPKIPDAAIIDDICRVLATHATVECELSSDNGECYLRRVLPYRTEGNRVAGAVITFIDISARKHAEDSLRERERDLKETVAKLNAEIIERERVESALVESTNEERRKLGRDLHDGLGQELSGLALLAAAAASSLRKAGRPEADQVHEIAHVANQAIGNCRAIAHGMSPLALAGGSLVTALREMVKLQRNSFGFDARCEVTEAAPLRLSQDALEGLYRIAQEAVGNARRHSGADAIAVTLNIQPTTVRLEIVDNGIGLSQAAASKTGMGLKIMEFRANLIAAHFAIGDHLPRGTRVTVDCLQPLNSRVIKLAAMAP
jgi:two-component system, chemotaxis family, CheB/CheR fusion protein